MTQEEIVVVKPSYFKNEKETGRLKDLDNFHFRYLKVQLRDRKESYCLLKEVNIEEHTLDVFLENSKKKILYKIPIKNILRIEVLTMEDLFFRFQEIFSPISAAVE